MKKAVILKDKEWIIVFKVLLNSLPPEKRKRYIHKEAGFATTQAEIKRVVKHLAGQIEFGQLIEWIQEAKIRID